jgi:hypothetical protein
VKCHARKERAEVIGTDQWITSGPAATAAALKGRIHGCTRIVSRKGQILFPYTAGAVHTWHFSVVSNALLDHTGRASALATKGSW